MARNQAKIKMEKIPNVSFLGSIGPNSSINSYVYIHGIFEKLILWVIYLFYLVLKIQKDSENFYKYLLDS